MCTHWRLVLFPTDEDDYAFELVKGYPNLSDDPLGVCVYVRIYMYLVLIVGFGKQLLVKYLCGREAQDTADRHIVAVKMDGTVIVHLPRKLSCVCSLFLMRGGAISR